MSTGSDIVVVSPKDIGESKALSKDLALSALMPMALRKKPEDVLAIVLTGAELGLAPMQAIRGIHIIEGKASLSAGLMAALVKRSPTCEYLRLVDSTKDVAIYETQRKGDPTPTQMKFTIEQAKAAGLTSKANWQRYPDAMLRSRALAAICREVYPDLCLGLYDSDSGELDSPERDLNPEPSAQQAHVEQVKAQLKTQLKPEIEDAEIVEADPLQAIRAAKTDAELQALIPQLKNLTGSDLETARAAYTARKAEIAGPL